MSSSADREQTELTDLPLSSRLDGGLLGTAGFESDEDAPRQPLLRATAHHTSSAGDSRHQRSESASVLRIRDAQQEQSDFSDYGDNDSEPGELRQRHLIPVFYPIPMPRRRLGPGFGPPDSNFNYSANFYSTAPSPTIPAEDFGADYDYYYYSPWIASCFAINYVVGAGLLAIPRVFYETGYVLAVAVLLFAALLNYSIFIWVVNCMRRAEAITTIANRLALPRTVLLSDPQQTTAALRGTSLQTLYSCMTLRRNEYQVNDIIGMFSGLRVRKVFELTFFLSQFITLWAFFALFGSSLVRELGIHGLSSHTCDVTQITWAEFGGGCHLNYGLWLFVFWIITCFLVCLDSEGQASFQVPMTVLRFLIILLMCVISVVLISASHYHYDGDNYDWDRSRYKRPNFGADVVPFKWTGVFDAFIVYTFALTAQFCIPDVAAPLDPNGPGKGHSQQQRDDDGFERLQESESELLAEDSSDEDADGDGSSKRRTPKRKRSSPKRKRSAAKRSHSSESVGAANERYKHEGGDRSFYSLEWICKVTVLGSTVLYVFSGLCISLFYGENTESPASLAWAHFRGFKEHSKGSQPKWCKVIDFLVVVFPAIDMLSAFPVQCISTANMATQTLLTFSKGHSIEIGGTLQDFVRNRRRQAHALGVADTGVDWILYGPRLALCTSSFIMAFLVWKFELVILLAGILGIVSAGFVFVQMEYDAVKMCREITNPVPVEADGVGEDEDLEMRAAERQGEEYDTDWMSSKPWFAIATFVFAVCMVISCLEIFIDI